jgi:hypothetical protein
MVLDPLQRSARMTRSENRVQAATNKRIRQARETTRIVFGKDREGAPLPRSLEEKNAMP